MNVDIITVGDEIVCGRIADVNTRFLANQVMLHGLNIRCCKIVGDDSSQIISCLKDSFKYASIVFVCGGLGPTVDDITRESIFEFLKEKVIFNKDIYLEIKEKFKARNLKMPSSNKKQAYVLENSTIIKNLNGTAPGIFYERNGVKLFVLPGPPSELKAMFERDVSGFLTEYVYTTFKKMFRVIGISESLVEEMVIEHIDDEINYGIYANGNLVDIVISTTKSLGVIAKIQSKFEEVLGENLYSTSQGLVEKLGDLLLKKNLSISFAESCTAGLLASMLVGYPSISKVFSSSFVTYSNASKNKELNVRLQTLEKYGAVSQEVCQEMAYGLYKKTGCDIAVSISGIAGPSGGTQNKPVGTVWICVYYKNKYYVEKFLVHGNRNTVRKNACNLGLFKVLQVLKEV